MEYSFRGDIAIRICQIVVNYMSIRVSFFVTNYHEFPTNSL